MKIGVIGSGFAGLSATSLVEKLVGSAEEVVIIDSGRLIDGTYIIENTHKHGELIEISTRPEKPKCKNKFAEKHSMKWNNQKIVC